jgi:hypothetical protein
MIRWGDLGVAVHALLTAGRESTAGGDWFLNRFILAIARIVHFRPSGGQVDLDLTGCDTLEGGWSFPLTQDDLRQWFARIAELALGKPCDGPQASWARKFVYLVDGVMAGLPDVPASDDWAPAEVGYEGDEYHGSWNFPLEWGEWAQIFRSLEELAAGRFNPDAPQARWAYWLACFIQGAAQVDFSDEELAAMDQEREAAAEVAKSGWEGKKPRELEQPVYDQMYQDLIVMAMEAYEGHPDQMHQAETAVHDFLTKADERKWTVTREGAADSFLWSRVFRGNLDWAAEQKIRLPEDALIDMTNAILGQDRKGNPVRRIPAQLVRAQARNGYYGQVTNAA